MAAAMIPPISWLLSTTSVIVEATGGATMQMESLAPSLVKSGLWAGQPSPASVQ